MGSLLPKDHGYLRSTFLPVWEYFSCVSVTAIGPISAEICVSLRTELKLCIGCLNNLMQRKKMQEQEPKLRN